MTYPKLIINKEILKKNIQSVYNDCKNSGINLVGVIKGVDGISDFTKVLLDAGISTIASSRLSQLRDAKQIKSDIQTYALRVPMLSEIEELVESADISLNSELVVLREINSICKKKNITHNVIIMVDLGDLREGIFNDDELAETVEIIENELTNIHLLGVGTNLGCYGSIMPTVEKMNELIQKANFISDKIGRKIEVISGGASTSFPLVARNEMPSQINELRIGDGLYVSDLDACFNYEMHSQESLILQAEIIEIKDKPSYPIGEFAVNAFGDVVEYEDKGIMKRALIAIGRQDIGDYNHLLPLDKEIEVIGGSSDHTILDIQNCSKEYKVGDIVEFHLMYGSMLMATQSKYVVKEFI
ncbi:alanine racemase [Facklamia hominis]